MYTVLLLSRLRATYFLPSDWRTCFIFIVWEGFLCIHLNAAHGLYCSFQYGISCIPWNKWLFTPSSVCVERQNHSTSSFMMLVWVLTGTPWASFINTQLQWCECHLLHRSQQLKQWELNTLFSNQEQIITVFWPNWKTLL